MEQYKEQGDRLKKFIDIEYEGVQVEFARVTGIAPANLNKYVTGSKRFKSEASMDKLRKAGLNPEWYLTGQGDMHYKDALRNKRVNLSAREEKVNIAVYEAPAYALQGTPISNIDELPKSYKSVGYPEKYLNPDKVFGFYASGLSMVGKGILPGDLLVISEEMATSKPNDKIVLVNLQGCIMVKYIKDDKLYSVPSYDVYEPIEQYYDDNLTILGVVFNIQREKVR